MNIEYRMLKFLNIRSNTQPDVKGLNRVNADSGWISVTAGYD